MQWSATKLCIHIRAHISYRCDQSSFQVIDLKLDTEPSLNVQLHHSGLLQHVSAALHLLQHGAWWSIVTNIYAQAGLTVGL